MSINNLKHITSIESSTTRNNTLEHIAPESPRHSTDTIASMTEPNMVNPMFAVPMLSHRVAPIRKTER